MSDVLRRLKKAFGYAPDWDHVTLNRRTVSESIDEIERLQAIVERLQRILSRIEAIQGCECDTYEGHRCLMCRVREIAREGLQEKWRT